MSKKKVFAHTGYPGGTKSVQVGPVTIGCMAPEARDLLDTIMEEYTKMYEERKGTSIACNTAPDDVYQFAYWLTRWSGLIQPAEKVKN